MVALRIGSQNHTVGVYPARMLAFRGGSRRAWSHRTAAVGFFRSVFRRFVDRAVLSASTSLFADPFPQHDAKPSPRASGAFAAADGAFAEARGGSKERTMAAHTPLDAPTSTNRHPADEHPSDEHPSYEHRPDGHRTDEHSPDERRPHAGQPHRGQSRRGQSHGGQSRRGQPRGGQSAKSWATSRRGGSGPPPARHWLLSPVLRSPVLLSPVLLSAVLLTGAAVLLLAPPAGAAPPAEPACAQGSFCTWGDVDYRAPVSSHAAQHVARERCVPLPADREVRSFANRTGHPVTVYQAPDCDTHAEFSTQSHGSRTPRSPFVARAITIWDH